MTGIEGRTLTCATPTPAAYPLYRRFGFHDLEMKWGVLLPLSSFGHPLAWLRYRIITKKTKIARLLTGRDRELFKHRRPPRCGYMLIHNRSARCYVVFTRVRGRRSHFSRVHHIGERAGFLENPDRIRSRMAIANRALFVTIDARLIRHVPLPCSREAGLTQIAVYRLTRVQPEQIDNLYTELVLLGL